jgi:hypothetical protein
VYVVLHVKRKMTVIFGKIHDLTKTDVGYKLIDIYANVAHEEVSLHSRAWL